MTATAALDGTFTLGTATDYPLPRDRMPWMGSPTVRPLDQPRGDRDGSTGGRDTDGPRLIVWPFQIEAADAAAANVAHAALKRAWRSDSTDHTLDVTLPGIGTRRYYGRCRGTTADLTLSNVGYITGTVIFSALDPYGYGEEENTPADSSSPVAVTNDGDVPTDRFTLKIIGSGGTPSVSNATDDGATVAFDETLGNGVEAVLDFRTLTVTVAGVVAWPLAAGARWFYLQPGANSLTFTGCTSVEVDHRPAYL